MSLIPETFILKKPTGTPQGDGYYQADPKEHIMYSISFSGILFNIFFLPEEHHFVYENMNNIT